MPPQSNSCFNHYITIIFNCKGFFINIFWICVYVRFFGLVLLLNLRYQLDVCVGANTVRPSKKQAHGNNKVRQQKILPDNPEFTANPEHWRTVFARRRNKPTVTTRFGSKKILPDNPEFTANPEHRRTVFARRSNKPTATTRFGSKKFSPTILNLQQILSTGERCSLVEETNPR